MLKHVRKKKLTVTDFAVIIHIKFAPFLLLSSFLCLFLILGCIPLLHEFVLPANVCRNLIDPVLDNRECLSHLIVLHVFLVIKFVGELK